MVMKKTYLFLLVLLTGLNIINASPVDSVVAKNVANSFYLQNAPLPSVNKNNSNLSLAYTRTENSDNIYYVFNTTNNSGWIIVAADDVVIPILGYSFEGNYSNTNQPPAFTYWMNSCKDQILYVKQNNVVSDIATLTKWNQLKTNTVDQNKSTKSVAALLTTTWDQGCYYNTLCPTDAGGDCNHVYTGCVATAMAQIMRYWNYPANGVGSYSYYHSTYGTQSANFGATTYNWASMPNNVTSNNTAVATLMYHCGVSVDMDYGPTGSGAFSGVVPDALINYFSYQNTAQRVFLVDYTTTDWINLLKVELDAQRPVYYSGNDGVSGHAFVCDGYDNSNNFHFNWGWSGSYNGYFAIGSLNPGTYYPNLDNAAIIYIAPIASNPCANVVSIGGIGLGYSKTYTGGGSGAWYTSSSNPCGYLTPGVENIYSFVAPTTGTYSIEVTAANGWVDYLWKSGSCSASGWNCIDDINATGTYGAMTWTAGSTYYLLLDDEDGIAGTHTFYIKPNALDDTLHYDTAPLNSLGSTTAISFGCYIYLPSATLAPHAAANHKILSVMVNIVGAANISSSQLRFYSNTGTTLLYSQNFTPIEGWNNVILTSPYTVPSSGDLYLGYYVVSNGGFYAGCDAGPANPNGNWIDYNGTWQHLTDIDASFDYNWNIKAICGIASSAPVASCTPLLWSAGNVNISTTVTSGTFTLSNTGSGNLTCSGISGLSAPFSTTLLPATVNLTIGQTKTFTFSYHPTIIGANNQTVVITTNGGNITINLSGTGTNCAFTTFPWIESFESPVFPTTCWTKASPDAGTGWAQIASGTTPLPGWQGGTMTVPSGGGNSAAYCNFNTGGATTNDQWLITPQISVPANAMLTFSLYWFGHYKDFVDIKVSTTSNSVSSFTTTLLALDTLQFIQNVWKQFYIPLNAYAGQNIYLAFNEHVSDNVNDGAFIGLDLVRVDITTDINEKQEDLFTIYPNPAKDKITIEISTFHKDDIISLFSSNGQLIIRQPLLQTKTEIDLSSFAKGLYFVKIENTEGVSMRKFVKE
jgi:hypothetical protein